MICPKTERLNDQLFRFQTQIYIRKPNKTFGFRSVEQIYNRTMTPCPKSKRVWFSDVYCTVKCQNPVGILPSPYAEIRTIWTTSITNNFCSCYKMVKLLHPVLGRNLAIWKLDQFGYRRFTVCILLFVWQREEGSENHHTIWVTSYNDRF